MARFADAQDIQDADGTYVGFGGEGKEHKAEGFDYYCDFSLWDTFRAQHPLLILLEPPKRISDMVRSLIAKTEQGGWLPNFPGWNTYTSAMIGDHAVSMITDAYVKGIRDFDAAFVRLFRQLENLGRLEMQVDSIMKWGDAEEREMISGLLESAASLIEVQAEDTPEIGRVASLLLKTLEDAFPARKEQWGRIDIGEFGESVREFARSEMAQQGRRLNLSSDFENAVGWGWRGAGRYVALGAGDWTVPGDVQPPELDNAACNRGRVSGCVDKH